MNSGLMRTPLVLYTRSQTLNSYGTATYTFTVGDTIFGQIKDCTAEEKTNHMKLDQVVTHKITSQWYPAIKHYDRFIASVSRDSTGVSQSVTFDIISIVDYRQEGHTLEMTCRVVE